jgi:hypothetical protein
MKRSVGLPLLAAAAAIAAPPTIAYSDLASAPLHFRLVEPVSWIVENERGDPQKAGPCGGSNSDWGTPSYVVNEYVGGSNMHLELVETIYHPGHYRVALAVNSMLELPPDPVATTRESERGPWSVSGEIQNPVQPPILADGLFPHSERPASPQTYEADITLPNINCDECFLQVLQWMNEHAFNNPGGYSYHHCAVLKITADPSKPIDTRWPVQRTEEAD